MKRISDKMQNAINTILIARNADEIAYAYYRISEVVKDDGFNDDLTSVGEKYIERANNL